MISQGQWFIKDDEKQKGISHFAVMSSNGDMICSITPMHLKRQQDIDNALAIAALPDCLEALKAIAAALTQPVQFTKIRNADSCDILRADCSFAMQAANAALKKAGCV